MKRGFYFNFHYTLEAQFTDNDRDVADEKPSVVMH